MKLASKATAASKVSAQWCPCQGTCGFTCAKTCTGCKGSCTGDCMASALLYQ